MNQVKKYITRATELTAISVSRLIKEKGFTPQDLLTEEVSEARERLIDQTGVDTMDAALADIPFVLNVVGSEGRKHIQEYGEALPTLEGTFGKGKYKLDMINDVVEGSKAAKLNSPGAVSVMAVGKGLLLTPSDIVYMDKLFGPPQLRNKISLNKSPEENLAEVMAVFGVKPAKINVVLLSRERNSHYINACQKFGVNLILIQARDFLPAVFACKDPTKHKKGIHLLMGSGGFEEGTLAAVAAKALGAVGEGRGWSAEQGVQDKYGKVWTTDDLVSGKRQDCLVSISAITDDDKWFDLKGVKEKNKGHEVTTLTVSADGVKIVNTVHR